MPSLVRQAKESHAARLAITAAAKERAAADSHAEAADMLGAYLESRSVVALEIATEAVRKHQAIHGRPVVAHGWQWGVDVVGELIKQPPAAFAKMPRKGA
jgi:hypothetical protein